MSLRTRSNPTLASSWIEIHPDNTILIRTGKNDFGQGTTFTAYRQIVADELSVPFEAITTVVAGDTDRTPDGSGAFDFLGRGMPNIRKAAAYTYQALVDLASERLGVPKEKLSVKDGIVSGGGKSISYGDLIKNQQLKLTIPVKGDLTSIMGLRIEGDPPMKPVSEYTVIGKSFKNSITSSKVAAKETWATDVRLPGMLHARVVHPKTLGSTLISAGQLDKTKFPNSQGIVKGNLVGVVAPTEWEAIQAAEQVAGSTKWTEWKGLPGNAKLYQHLREESDWTSAPVGKGKANKGDVGPALATAKKKLSATYQMPFMKHAPIGPTMAVADVKPDGMVHIYTHNQNPQELRGEIAMMLRATPDHVIVHAYPGPGHYGRSNGGNAGAEDEAVILSQALGKPVRVQWMRHDMHAWGSKGPAVTCDLSASFDPQGEVTAVKFTSWAFSGGDIMYRPDAAGNYLGAQLAGVPNTTGIDEFAQWGSNAPPYSFPNIHAVAHVVPAFYDVASPLRTTHLRDPEGPATSFAVESFIDELAVAAGADPIEFRVKHIGEKRAVAVLKAAAQKAGWDARPSPKKRAGTGDLVTGRGVALGTRNGTYVGTIAEVEVNRRTGMVRVTRFVCVHDCGLIINPEAVRTTVAANLIQSMSRTLYEEVTFDRSSVTSVDWTTYPVARASNIPTRIEIELINHPEIPSSGAGEPSTRPTPAAIANAVFDATGARVRQGPLSPARVKAAIAALRHA